MKPPTGWAFTLLGVMLAVALLPAASVASTPQDHASSRSAIPSAGCGLSSIEPGGHTGESGFEWELFVPDVHDSTTPIPLVVSLHGGWESSGVGYDRIAGAAAVEGFAVLAPHHDRHGAWMWWLADTVVDPEPTNPEVARLSSIPDALGACCVSTWLAST